MATEQMNITEAIAQAVAWAARAAVKAMPVARTDNGERNNAVPKIGRPVMKQPIFDWETEDKCSKLKNFIPEVNNVFESSNMLQTERVGVIKMARQERPTILRNIGLGRTRKI